MEKFGAILSNLDEAVEGMSEEELTALGFDTDYGYPIQQGKEFIDPAFLKSVLAKLNAKQCEHAQLYAYLAVNFCVPVAHSSAQEMETVHVKVTEAIEKGINTHPQIKYYLSDKIEICEYPNENT